MNQAKRNYIVDAVIGLGFVVTAISALVFLVPLNWIDFGSSATPTVLGINFGIWQLLHTVRRHRDARRRRGPPAAAPEMDRLDDQKDAAQAQASPAARNRIILDPSRLAKEREQSNEHL